LRSQIALSDAGVEPLGVGFVEVGVPDFGLDKRTPGYACRTKLVASLCPLLGVFFTLPSAVSVCQVSWFGAPVCDFPILLDPECVLLEPSIICLKGDHRVEPPTRQPALVL
jgi:hypothetical protein